MKMVILQGKVTFYSPGTTVSIIPLLLTHDCISYGSLCSTYAQHGASRDIVLQMKSKVKDPLSFTSFMQDNTPRDINL